MTDPEDDQIEAPAEIAVLYIGTEPIRVDLRDGRAAAFSVEHPEHSLPAASAQDLLSPAIGGRRFIRLAKGGS